MAEGLRTRIFELAERLVASAPVSGTAGEASCGRLLAERLQEQLAQWPRSQVVVLPAPGEHAPPVVLALSPAATPTRRTLLLLGHYDTVGHEPYGPLAAVATDTAALRSAYAGRSAASIAADAASADWAFGRGWLDMLGGVAVLTELFLTEAIRQASGTAEALPANLALLLTPDEERDSRGIRTALPVLTEQLAQRGWDLSQVVCADYSSPEVSSTGGGGCLYTGTVGKLLLGISVFGAPTHAGEPFAGLNSAALSAALAAGLEHSPRLLATGQGQWLPPPTVLDLSARRERYDVMTPDCSELLLNVFHLGGIEPLWGRLLSEVRRLCRLHERELGRRYSRYCARSNTRPPHYGARCEVLDYAELVRRSGSVEAGELPLAPAEHEPRGAGLAAVRPLAANLPADRPRVVLTALLPFYAASGSYPQLHRLKAWCAHSGLRQAASYPYISDLSFLAASPRQQAGLDFLASRAPVWLPEAELAAQRRAATPVCNLGPWGYGAHSAGERVYLPWLLEELPARLGALLRELAGSN